MRVYQALRVLENLRTHGILEAGGTVMSAPTSDRTIEADKILRVLRTLKNSIVHGAL